MQAQEQAKLTNPEAIKARKESRTKFAGLNTEAATKIDGEAFPGVINEPAGGPPKLPTGESITGYLSDNAASVNVGGGKQALVESMEPIAIQTSSGGLTPIDLALSDDGSSFAPTTPAVGVSIPKRLSDGISLAGTGISLTPVDGSGALLGGSEGTVDGASVLYANTQTDMDSLVKPTTDGFAADTWLRSVESPQQLFFRVGLPAGASLVQARDGSGVVDVVKEGTVIAAVLPAGARDAVGTSVPVSMSVSGNTLVLSLEDRSAEYQYPIEVDPTIIDSQLVESNGERTHWQWHAEPSGDFKEVRGSNYLETQGAGEYAEKNWAAWAYETHGDSKIFDVSTKTGPAKNKEAKVESYLELEHAEGNKKLSEEKEGKGVKEATTEISNESKEPEYTEKGVSVCPDNSKNEQECLPEWAHEKNAVVFEQAATSAPKGHKFEDRLDEAFVSISEPAGQHATASFNKTTSGYKVEVEEGREKVVQERPNALYGSGAWLSKAKTGAVLGLIGEDKGIGVDDTKLEYESAPGKWELISSCAEHNYRKGTECHKEANCEGVQCYEKHEETWLLESKLPNGEDKVRYRAEEAMEGTESPASEDEVAVKVDTSKPHSLFLGGLPYGNELSEKSYELTAYASDGEGSTVASSGIESIKLYVDNSEIKPVEGTNKGCSIPRGECMASAKFKLEGVELGAGRHAIVIVAKDRAGNEGREEETISIRHSTPVPLGPGSVDLQSGDFALGPTDVSLGGGLSVSRVYSSRDLTAGAEGPLGPQWSLGVGSEEALVEMPDHSVLVTSGNGGQTIFAAILNSKKEPTGKFEAPPGDSNLTMTLEENEKTKEKIAYYLKDPAAGTSTEFTLSSTAKVWLPSDQEGPVPTNTVSYFYETVEVGGKKVTRPSEERGATPAKELSCAPEGGKIKPGCRGLKFTYATATKAKGEGPSEWGEYEGRLSKVSYEGYNPATKKMTETPISVAEYAYDKQGRLRAEWDPRLAPHELKTTYGYDEEGHVTVVNPPGQEPWIMHYGVIKGDAGTGRLLSLTRPKATTKSEVEATDGRSLPVSSGVPKPAGTPVEGGTLIAENGTWSNSPLSYSYQWENCRKPEAGWCQQIPGATSPTFQPTDAYVNEELKVKVTATNSDGSVTAASSAATEKLKGIAASYVSEFGKGTLGSKFTSKYAEFGGTVADAVDSSGNVWVLSTAKSGETESTKVYVFNSAGTLLHTYSVSGVGTGIAINQSTGEVYIGDAENNKVWELSSKGEAQGSFELDEPKFGNTEKHKNWVDVAVDSNGDVWASDYDAAELEEFSENGTKLIFWKEVGDAEWEEGPSGLAVANGYVYVTTWTSVTVSEREPRLYKYNYAGMEQYLPGTFEESGGAANPDRA